MVGGRLEFATPAPLRPGTTPLTITSISRRAFLRVSAGLVIVVALTPKRVALAGNVIGQVDDGNGGYIRVETPDADNWSPYNYHMNVRGFDSSGGAYMNAHVYYTARASGSGWITESSAIFDNGYAAPNGVDGATTTLPTESAGDLPTMAENMGWDIQGYMNDVYGPTVGNAGSTLMSYGYLQEGCEDLWTP